MKNLALIFTLLSAFALSGCGFPWENQSGPWKNTNSTGSVETWSQSVSAGTGARTETWVSQRKSHVIQMTKDGFNPSALTISQGDSVSFLNADSRPHWPASDRHPTHTFYPGSDIRKCDTAEAANIFDACKSVSPNESFNFVFTQAWTWGFHDHLNPRSLGKITVQKKTVTGTGATSTGATVTGANQ